MNWTKESAESHTSHIKLDTPIGEYVIFWKRRKKYTSYGIELKDEWLGTEYDLESAKSLVENHLLETQEKLNEFINQSKEVYKPVRVEA